jgi:hypothetical protein
LKDWNFTGTVATGDRKKEFFEYQLDEKPSIKTATSF